MNNPILLKPPLIELVIGIQFNDIVFDTNSIIKIYNSLLIKSFPNIEERTTIPSIIEEYNKPTITKILNEFHSRKIFIGDDKNKLIQIQCDKILFNWRKSNDKELYPRFDNVYKEFIIYLNKIDKIFKCKNLINQYEITYIDHFQLDMFNLEKIKISKLFNIFSLNEEISNIRTDYSIPKSEINGNLNVSIISAKRNSDNKEIIVLETTCRGFNNNNIDDWFKISHNILNKYFFDILTDNTKNVLGLKYE